MKGTTRIKVRKFLIERDGLKCCWCDKICDTTKGMNYGLYPTIEHVLPRSMGGTDHPDNLKIACKKCNSERGYNLGAFTVRKKKKINTMLNIFSPRKSKSLVELESTPEVGRADYSVRGYQR